MDVPRDTQIAVAQAGSDGLWVNAEQFLTDIIRIGNGDIRDDDKNLIEAVFLTVASDITLRQLQREDITQ